MPGGVDMKIFERDKEENALLEGSRVIKHDGKYYLLMISWPQGGIADKYVTGQIKLPVLMRKR